MSEDKIGDAIVRARTPHHPHRILLNTETLYQLINEPKSRSRLNRSNFHNAPWCFFGTPIMAHDDFPAAGFAFQQRCKRCTAGNDRGTIPFGEPVDLIARGCRTCGDTGYVTTFCSPEWEAAKEKKG